MISWKLVLWCPADVELYIIERAQSPFLRQPPDNMPAHGEMMDTTYLRMLLDAQKVIFQDFKFPSYSLIWVAPETKRSGVWPIDVDALFWDDEVMEKKEQIVPTGLTDANQVAVGHQLQKFAKTSEEMVDARNNQDKVP